jgi:hypothetical protein
MGANIDALTGEKLGRASLIKKDERSNHLPML